MLNPSELTMRESLFHLGRTCLIECFQNRKSEISHLQFPYKREDVYLN